MKDTPLSVRLRPEKLEEFIGQEHVLAQGKLLHRAIASKRIPSLILWGPSGCGKTTLGYIVAQQLNAKLHYLNAAFSSIAEVKGLIKQARTLYKEKNTPTVLFIDEIHRFNKTQQEILVPDTEEATIILIGATIYKPYFCLIPSIISRSLVAEFKPLNKEHILQILKQALTDKEKGLAGFGVAVTNKALEHIACICNGDARRALNALEIGVLSVSQTPQDKTFDLEAAKESIQKQLFYDRKSTYHYDTISALIKSIRGSDADSALYWLAKMIKSGEDQRFIARRLVILASEDIGNANPFALVLATSCVQAIEFVGPPESDLILAHATIYLATCAKSNACYKAINAVKEDLDLEETRQVPDHIKTQAKNYPYPHSFGGYVKQNYGAKKQYYFPTDSGDEKQIKIFFSYLKGEKNEEGK